MAINWWFFVKMYLLRAVKEWLFYLQGNELRKEILIFKTWMANSLLLCDRETGSCVE